MRCRNGRRTKSSGQPWAVKSFSCAPVCVIGDSPHKINRGRAKGSTAVGYIRRWQNMWCKNVFYAWRDAVAEVQKNRVIVARIRKRMTNQVRPAEATLKIFIPVGRVSSV
jgi:hypothetical protein